MVDLICLHCQTKLPVPENKIGTRVFVCPQCSMPLDAPGQSTPAPVVPAVNIQSEDRTVAPDDESALYVQQKLREVAEKRAQRSKSGAQPVLASTPVPPTTPPATARPRTQPQASSSKGLLWGVIGGGVAVVLGLAILVIVRGRMANNAGVNLVDNNKPIAVEQKQPEITPNITPPAVAEPVTVASLIKTLKEGTPARRKTALNELKQFPDSRAALGAVLEQLSGEDEEVKALARATIAQWGPPTKSDLTVYSAALRDPAPEVRIHAAAALAEIGAPAKDELLFLRVMALDENPMVQDAAQKAVTRIEGSSINVLIDMLKEKAPNLRSKAATELAEMGPNAKPALPNLMEALHDKNPAVRSSVRETLQAIGPDAVGALAEALREKNIEVRANALHALGKMQSDARSVLPEMIPLLYDPDTRIKDEALQAVSSMGDYAVGPLVQALEREKTPSRQKVLAQALGQMSPETSTTLQSALSNTSPEVAEVTKEVVQKVAKQVAQSPRAPVKPLAGTAGLIQGQLIGWFNIQDRDQDGFLDKSELAVAIRGANAKAFDADGKTPLFKDISRYPDYSFLSMADRDGDGRISRNEYERWARDYALYTKQDFDEKQRILKMQQSLLVRGLKNQMRVQRELAVQQSWANYHVWRRGQGAMHHAEWMQRWVLSRVPHIHRG